MRVCYLCDSLSYACLHPEPSRRVCGQPSLPPGPPYAGKESEAVAKADVAGQTPSPDPYSSPGARERERKTEGGRRRESTKQLKRAVVSVCVELAKGWTLDQVIISL